MDYGLQFEKSSFWNSRRMEARFKFAKTFSREQGKTLVKSAGREEVQSTRKPARNESPQRGPFGMSAGRGRI